MSFLVFIPGVRIHQCLHCIWNITDNLCSGKRRLICFFLDNGAAGYVETKIWIQDLQGSQEWWTTSLCHLACQPKQLHEQQRLAASEHLECVFKSTKMFLNDLNQQKSLYLGSFYKFLKQSAVFTIFLQISQLDSSWGRRPILTFHSGVLIMVGAQCYLQP